VVLHADDLNDPLRLGHLRRGHVGETNVAHETLALKLGYGRDLPFDRSFSGAVDVAHDSHVDDIERVETEIAKVVMDAALEIFRFERRDPRAIVTPDGAHLA
jgi:hypothetical protein